LIWSPSISKLIVLEGSSC